MNTNVGLAIRSQELIGIQNKIKSILIEDIDARQKDVNMILSRLPDPSHDTTLSIGGYPARFREHLSSVSSTSGGKPTPDNKESRPTKLSSYGVLGKLDIMGKVATRVGSAASSAEPVVQRLLTALDVYISDRHTKIADEILAWRNRKVGEWEETLAMDPDNVIS